MTLDDVLHVSRVNRELRWAFGDRDYDDGEDEPTLVRIDPRLIEWLKNLGEK